ncbi:MAG: hypothetical protein IPK87_01035 [Planctomycetes bacterium]|nr:hypothetical protein [Planctomycetota bacterium]
MEKFEKEHGKNVACLFVYTKEAHPDDGPENRNEASPTGGWKMKGNKVKIDEHKKYAERLKAANDLKSAGKDEWRVLVDGMDNAIHKAWGELPNMAWLIDPKGRIAHKWAWVASSTSDKGKRNGDDKTGNVYTLLKAAGSLTPYSIQDDTRLPLWGVRGGEWLKYQTPDGNLEVKFDLKDAIMVKRTAGKEEAELKLAVAIPEKPAKPDIRVFKVGKLEFPCYVVTNGDTESWTSPWLPGDGVAKVLQDGKVTLELTDAGFEKGKSCLNAYKPE